MQLIKKQRIKFTTTTTILAAVFLLVMLGGFFGLISLSNTLATKATLQKALNSPADYNQKAPQNLRCFFIYSNTIDGSYVVDGDVDFYGENAEDIAEEAIRVGNGRFKKGGRHFVAESAQKGDITLIAVMDKTDYREQMITIALLMVTLYCCIVALSALLSYLLSAKQFKPIADAMTKQRDLTANASHELKTPLTVISANLSVIKSEPNSTVEDNAHWIDSIDAQISRMQGLIQNMLELSKMESSRLPFEKLDMTDITEGACLSFEPVCFEKGVTLYSSVTRGAYVFGDKASLERLLAILLDNAIKYCSDKGKVGVYLQLDQKKVRILVMNTGESITDEEAQHVFDRFYRTDGARQNEDNKSFGLGLAIAAATVEAHGGTISCHGVDGKGSVFTVLLPAYSEKSAKKLARKQKQS